MPDIRCDISLTNLQPAHTKPIAETAIEIDSFSYSWVARPGRGGLDLENSMMQINMVVHDAANVVTFIKALAAETKLGLGLYIYAQGQNERARSPHILSITSASAKVTEVHHSARETDDHAPFEVVLLLSKGDMNMNLRHNDGTYETPENSGLSFGPSN